MRIGTSSALLCGIAAFGLCHAQEDTPRTTAKDQAVVRTNLWQLPDDRIGVRTAPILLLTRDDVAADLKLSEEQRGKSWNMIDDLGRQAAQLKGRNDKDALVLRRKIDQAQLEWLSRELTPEQNARLNQIDLQWEGPAALVNRPQIAQTVHLTEAQKKKIREILAAEGTKSRPIELAGRADLIRKVFRELDETQQQTWRALIGPDFFVVPKTASAR